MSNLKALFAMKPIGQVDVVVKNILKYPIYSSQPDLFLRIPPQKLLVLTFVDNVKHDSLCLTNSLVLLFIDQVWQVCSRVPLQYFIPAFFEPLLPFLMPVLVLFVGKPHVLKQHPDPFHQAPGGPVPNHQLGRTVSYRLFHHFRISGWIFSD